jgi:16S rRNA (guanine(966)-N(2))-methyltransferase RsmD
MRIRKRKNDETEYLKDPEIRISTGAAKNKRIKAPAIEGFRAVQEVAKSSVFSIIGEKIKDAVCLDLFAGSGNMGLEALSRGARWCDFVDENHLCVEAIRENIVNCGFFEITEVFRKEASKYVNNTDKKYDLVFLDPFYQDTAQKHLVSNLGNIFNEGGVAVFFHGDNLDLPTLTSGTNLTIIEERKFGKSFFTMITKA